MLRRLRRRPLLRRRLLQRFAKAPAAVVPVVAKPAAVASASAAERMTDAERKKALEGVAELKAIVAERARTGVQDETRDGCDARLKRVQPRIDAAEAKAGARIVEARTRYGQPSPDIEQSIEYLVSDCVTGCLIDTNADLGNDEWRELARTSCRKADVALDDAARMLRTPR